MAATVLPDRERFSASACRFDNRCQPLEEVRVWLADERDAAGRAVERTDLRALDGWSWTAGGEALVHRSGGFFRIAGARIASSFARWDQPLIEQFEVGTLGFVVAEIEGLLHFLVQAKLEPGSPKLVQLAPTLQATHGNAARLHRGRAPALAECFAQGRGRVVVEASLSECGAHFSRKRNRNVIVELDEAIEAPPGFRWLTLAELRRLCRESDMINMPARSVLALLAALDEPTPAELEHGEHGLAELRAWLEARARATRAEIVPRGLLELEGWELRDGALSDCAGELWSIVGVRVRAPGREVSSWCQPLLSCRHEGRATLVIQERDGRDHALLEARFEPGTGLSLGPSIAADAGLACPWERAEPALASWLAGAGEVLFDVVQSREGGRYLATRHHYRVVRVPARVELPLPSRERHRWVTLAQLKWFLRATDVVHLDLRELLAMGAFEP